MSTKLTPGALRAAKAVYWELTILDLDREDRLIPNTDDINFIAETIDRETDLPELLGAAEAANTVLRRLCRAVDQALIVWARPDRDGLLEAMRTLDRCWEQSVNTELTVGAAITKAQHKDPSQ